MYSGSLTFVGPLSCLAVLSVEKQRTDTRGCRVAGAHYLTKEHPGNCCSRLDRPSLEQMPVAKAFVHALARADIASRWSSSLSMHPQIAQEPPCLESPALASFR